MATFLLSALPTVPKQHCVAVLWASAGVLLWVWSMQRHFHDTGFLCLKKKMSVCCWWALCESCTTKLPYLPCVCTTYNAVFRKSTCADITWWGIPARQLVSWNNSLKRNACGLPRNLQLYILNDTAVSANESVVELSLPDFTSASLSANFLSSQVK